MTAKCAGFACAAASGLLVSGAHAEQWQITPIASMSGEYSDNPRLLLEEAKGAYGWVGDFQLGLTRLAERTSIALQSSLEYAHYTDEDDFDRNDRSLALDIEHVTERSRWTTDVQVARNNTLTSEFETTGLVRTNKIREAFSASGGFSHQLSEALVSGTELSWTSNHYRDAEFTELIDYDYGRASLFGEWRASDRTRWSLYANASELQPEFARPTTNDFSLMLHWTFVPMELWTIKASAGPSLAESEVERQSGAVYAVDVSRRTEKGNWSMAASRERTPTGLGVLALSDRISIATNQVVSDRLSFSFQGVAGKNRDVFSEGAYPLGLKFARLEARLGWRLSPELRFDLMLAGMQQNNERASTARNYSVALGFSWNGEPFYL